jgi:hypothetical protein
LSSARLLTGSGRDFAVLLPSMVTSGTAIELAHALLDLPLQAAVLDREAGLCDCL